MKVDPALPRPQFRFAARVFVYAALSCILCVAAARAQSRPLATLQASASLPDAPIPANAAGAKPSSNTSDVTLINTPRNLLHDQAAIWTSPIRLRPHDLEWLAPMAVATGVAIGTDHYTMTQVVSRNSSFNQASINTSDAMVYSLVATPVVLYGFGHCQQNAHEQEAGILTGEAMVDSVVVEQGLKLIFWRERPNQDSARGRFFQSSAGVDSSFPSSHTLIAWSAASALAAEYPSHWARFALYSAATGIGITRVLGQEHFPSDVLVGAAAGWLIGHYVVQHHRRPPSLFPRQSKVESTTSTR